jgi:hypothetical protein
MDLFSTGYDPAEWDLVSTRSEGEYLSLTESEPETPSHPVPLIPLQNILMIYQNV